MIDPDHPQLSIARECGLASISQSGFYYRPARETPLNQGDHLSRAGELLIEMEKAKSSREPGANRGTTRSPESTASSQRLADLGFTKDQSADFRKLARVPAEEFTTRDAQYPTPSLNSFVKPELTLTYKPPSRATLKVCGIVHALEREGFLEQDPATNVADMSPPMIEDLRRLLPSLIEWIRRLDAHVR